VHLERNEATVGITDSRALIVNVEIQKEGTEVKQFQQMDVVKSIKSVSDIFSPVTGKITKVNAELGNSPEMLNQDPYGKVVSENNSYEL
jgi:glycine cleavage system H protein